MGRFVETTRGGVVRVRERCRPRNCRAATGVGPICSGTRPDALALLSGSGPDGVHQAVGGGGEVVWPRPERAEEPVPEHVIRVLYLAVHGSNADAIFKSSGWAIAALECISIDSCGSGINDTNAINGVVLGPT